MPRMSVSEGILYFYPHLSPKASQNHNGWIKSYRHKTTFMYVCARRHHIVGHGVALVESIAVNQRAVGSTPPQAAM